jgi:hypothetical protein
MRLLIINLLATALLIFGAASASAWSVTMVEQTSYDGQVVNGSETIIIDIYLDATEVGLQLFTIPVVYDPTILAFDSGSSSEPSYILYSAGTGATPAVYLYPQSDPLIEWPGLPTPGAPGGQVNLGWLSTGLNPTGASGLGIHIATMVFHVTGAPGDGVGEIGLLADGNGWTLRVDGVQYPSSSIGTSGSVAVLTPEPTTALLVGLGLIGLGVAGRRRA